MPAKPPVAIKPGSPAPAPQAGTTKPAPAGKPASRGFDSMFSPSHFVNGVRTNKAPY